MTHAVQSANRAPRPSGLADVLDLVLDKGIVIDAYVRLAVIGIEILTIDARVVIASVDTYLRFAEAVNRLDIESHDQVGGLPGLMGQVTEGGAAHKTRGALQGVKESVVDALSSGSDEDSGRETKTAGARRPRARTTRTTNRSRA